MGDTYLYLRFHVIVSTKDRLPLISEEWRKDLYSYMGGIIRHERGKLIEANGRPDHVHLLLSTRADQSIAEILRLIKTDSSRWIKGECSPRRNFHWQDGYGAFTVSASAEARVARYIVGQTKHHQRVDFKTEFREFLRAHHIEYDERYIWK
ncbi:MAG: IS200/IS605 family transposase [Acidobacteriia bacterium]|nr:IS200/IS605 family transposase [Terriglobia bacterium]